MHVDGFTENFEHFVKRHSEPRYLPLGLPAYPIEFGSRGSQISRRMYILPSGATYITDYFGNKTTYEPQPTSLEGLEDRKRYISNRLQNAEAAFNRLKNALICESTPYEILVSMRSEIKHASFNWDPSEFGPELDPVEGRPRGETSLLILKSIVRAYKKLLKTIVDKIEALPEVIAEKFAEQQQAHFKNHIDQQFQSQQRKARHQIEKIEL